MRPVNPHKTLAVFHVAKPGHGCSPQTGVALITALLITAFVVILAVAMVDSQQLDIRRTGNILFRDQAYIYNIGLESITYQMLKEDKAKEDHYGDIWACEGIQLPFQNGQLLPLIEDLQGRFNVNNLVKDGKHSPNDIKRLRNLLDIIKEEALKAPETAEDEALMAVLREMNSTDLTNAVVDWIDADTESLPGGAEDSDYQNGERPYRTANRTMASVSELLLVRGFNPTLYRLVEPHITALPIYTRINAHTASTQVLRALAVDTNCVSADKLQRPVRRSFLAECKALEDQTGEEKFSDADKFLAHDAFGGCNMIGTLGKKKNQQQNANEQKSDPEKDKDGEAGDDTGAGDPPQTNSDPNAQAAADVISVNSEFFLLRARTDLGAVDQSVGVLTFSLIQRKDGKLVTISRSQGVY